MHGKHPPAAWTAPSPAAGGTWGSSPPTAYRRRCAPGHPPHRRLPEGAACGVPAAGNVGGDHGASSGGVNPGTTRRLAVSPSHQGLATTFLGSGSRSRRTRSPLGLVEGGRVGVRWARTIRLSTGSAAPAERERSRDGWSVRYLAASLDLTPTDSSSGQRHRTVASTSAATAICASWRQACS